MTDITSALGPDEKVCPFCAETIKAAAIKCRFCQSDLPTDPSPAAEPEEVATLEGEEPTLVDVAPLPDDEFDPVRDPVREPVPASGPGHNLTWMSGARWIAVLTVLCVLLAGALAFLVHRAGNSDLDIAPNGQVTANSFRNAAMSSASEAAAKALSYGYKTFDSDRKQARALMTPSLAKQYDGVMDKVKAQTASTKLTLKATVMSAGLLSVTEHNARVLLFVNTVTTREGSKKQQLDENRVLMELTRKDGDWIVSKMDAF
jgi:hypothetical protein